MHVNPAGRRLVELPDDVAIERTQILEYYPPEVRAFAQDAIVADMRAKGKWAGETPGSDTCP